MFHLHAHVGMGFLVATTISSAGFAGSTPSFKLTHISPLEGDNGSEGLGLSAGGRVVGVSLGASGEQPYTWTPDGIVSLPQLTDVIFGYARDTNATGTIVGESSISGFQSVAALWTPLKDGWNVQELGILPGHIFSRADSINEAGTLIGGCSDDAFAPSPAVWELTTARGESSWDIVPLPVASGDFAGFVNEVNGNDVAVGSSADVGSGRAALWTRGKGGDWTVDVLPGLPTVGALGEARGINDSHFICGWSLGSDGREHAVLWQDGQISDLGTFEDERTYANALNNHGDVVGESWAFGLTRALVWLDGTMYDLNDVVANAHDWQLKRASAINDAGQIVGWGDLDGFKHSFLLTPMIVGDLNGDGVVGPADLAALLGAWGPCLAIPECPADLDGDGTVDPADLALLLGSWG